MTALIVFNCLQVIKKPFLAMHYLWQAKCGSLFKKPFFSYFIERIIQVDEKDILAKMPGAVTYNILTKNSFYKMTCLSNRVKKECENYREIARHFPKLKSLLPEIQYRRFLCFDYLKMPCYQSVGLKEAAFHARTLLEGLAQYANKELISLERLPYVAHGLKISHILFGQTLGRKLRQKVEVLLSLPWTIGPVHGDFHLSNIVKGNMQQPLFIDLDEFSREGLLSLDALNMMLDIQSREKGLTWSKTLTKALALDEELGNEISHFLDYDLKQVSLLYALRRLGYESYHYFFLSDAVRAQYSFIINLLDDKP